MDVKEKISFNNRVHSPIIFDKIPPPTSRQKIQCDEDFLTNRLTSLDKDV